MSTRQNRFNVGDVIDGKYEVVKVLPVGGMGELYKVRHLHLNDFRAVKVLKKNLLSDATQKQRFLREAKIAASIKHPNLASLFDFSSLPDGSYYMVQEFIDGVTLAERMRSGEKFDVPFVIRLAQQVLGGLGALHEEGIIHRDISPDNLMLTTTAAGVTRIKIIDLGIAKPVDAGEGLTSAGFFVGKLHYASPEQAGMIEPGQKVDHRTDLYSLGVVLYQMVAGRMPFNAESPQSYFLKQVSQEVNPLTPPGQPAAVPPDVEQFILRLLRKDREERFTSTADALEQLSTISSRFTTAATMATASAAPPPPPFPEAEEEEGGETVVEPLASLRAEAEKAMSQQVLSAPADVFSSELYDETQLDADASEDRITAEHPLPSSSQEAPAPAAEEPSGWEIPPALGSTPEAPSWVNPPAAPSWEPPGAGATVVTPQMDSALAAAILGAGASASAPDDSASRRAASPPPMSPASMPTMVETPMPPPSLPTMVETPMPPPSLPTMVETPIPAGTIVQSAPPPEGTTVIPMMAPPGGPMAGAATPRKGGSGVIIVVAVFVLLLLAGAVAGAWYFMRGKGQEPQTASVEPTPVATPIPTPVPVITPDTSVMIDPSLTGGGGVDTSLTFTDVIPPNLDTMATSFDTMAPPTPFPTTTPKPTPRKRATPKPRTTPIPTPTAVSTPTPPPTPPPVREGDLVRAGDAGVTEARIARWAAASYPRAAERLRASGTTELQVLVGTDGQPEQIRVSKSSGYQVLDDEAQVVARKSSYAGARKEGVKVRMWIPVRVTFQRP